MCDQLEVDGILRPRLNALGRPIHPSEEGIVNFWCWFGDSQCVDEIGQPLVVCHGTSADFDAFDTSRMGAVGQGAYFSLDRRVAGQYAMINGSASSGRVVPVYLSLQRPYVINGTERAPSRKQLERRGYDGIVYTHGWNDGAKSVEYIAFRPEQIKSALGNSGRFDPERASLTDHALGPKPKAQRLASCGMGM